MVKIQFIMGECRVRAARTRPYIIIIVVVVTLMTRITGGERAYPLGCSQQDPSYYDFDHASFPPPNIPLRTTDDYLLVRRLGAGRFSDVFEAVDVTIGKPNDELDPRTMVVIKVRRQWNTLFSLA
jgi:hypothetical protein